MLEPTCLQPIFSRVVRIVASDTMVSGGSQDRARDAMTALVRPKGEHAHTVRYQGAKVVNVLASGSLEHAARMRKRIANRCYSLCILRSNAIGARQDPPDPRRCEVAGLFEFSAGDARLG
jgi:hypothetical protein